MERETNTIDFYQSGIKRDRLPWMGDLAVSLMASAYTFCHVESVRWTLRVLGRCGANKLSPPSDFPTKGENKEASIASCHINGIVDYSLWYFICHWLHQRYFGDITFLLQEWRLIEQRLRYLLLCCSDKDTGMYIINDDDYLFIDWNGDRAEKSRSLQILWWYALNCAISLAQKVIDQVAESGRDGCMSVFITMLSDRQSRLENSYLQMNDIQHGFSRHSHILGVGRLF
jgi:alpha-L-rhamnosidase